MRAARPGFKLLELVHRLDRETSGLLMLAKKRAQMIVEDVVSTLAFKIERREYRAGAPVIVVSFSAKPVRKS